ncbi:OmpH multi-domain protein [Pyrenophora tritici-repentis]|nr:OmpH multi-domain protein [Pyrenophora tritici-repentis]
MPSPAAGKGDAPRTPTKLGRKPQAPAPKLNKPQAGGGALSGARGLAGRASNLAGKAKQDPQGAAQDAGNDVQQGAQETAEDAQDTAESTAEGAQDTADSAKDTAHMLKGLEVDEEGLIKNQDGRVVGRLVEGDAEDLTGYPIGDNGEILDDDGDLVGRCELTPEMADEQLQGAGGKMPDVDVLKGLTADRSGQILNEDGDFVGHLVDGDPSEIQGREFNENGEILDDDGNVIAKAELSPEAADLPAYQQDDDEEEEEEGGAAEGVTKKAQQAKDDVKDTAEDAAEGAKDDVEEKAAEVEDELPGVEALEGMEINTQADKLKESAAGALDTRILDGLKVNKKGKILDSDGEEIGELTDGDISKCAGKKVNGKGEVLDKDGKVIGKVDVVAEMREVTPEIDELEGFKVNKKGQVLDEEGEPIGELVEGDAAKCAGKKINERGEVVDKDGNVLGKVKALPKMVEASEVQEPEVKEVEVIPEINELEGLKVNKKGQVLDEEGESIGELVEGDAAKCAGKKINEKGEVLDKDGNVIGKVKALPKMVEQQVGQAEDAAEDAEGAAEDAQDAAEDAQDAAEDAEQEELELDEDGRPPVSILDGLKCNKAGKLIDSNGNIVGELIEGDAKKLSKSGTTCDAEGQFWDNKGKVIGRAQTVPKEEGEEEAPFAGLDGLVVVKDGFVEDDKGNRVGQVVEGDAKKLVGRAVDEDGDILDKKGSVDLSILAGRTVNKQGNVIGDEGVPIARLVEGNPKELSGRKIDENGLIFNDTGKQIGRCELIPMNERESKPEGIFAGLEGLRVIQGGMVADEDDNTVGRIVEGNPKRLVGMAVDEDGDILDKYGNVKGHAEPLEDEEEEEPADLSILDGLTLNKQGYLVNAEGIPVGKLVEGNLAELAGRKSDGEGLIHGDTGKVVGQCDIIPPNERPERKEGPFAGFEGLRVVKDGFVEDNDGNRVGQLTEGDPKRLVGHTVDEDGDIIDKYGNVKGHAEPLEDEEEEEPADLSILDGLTLNKQGYLVNAEGIPVGKLVEGNLAELAGRKSDGEGLIHGDTGKVVGRCDIIPPNERPERKEGPFAGFEGLRVVKDGFVEDNAGNHNAGNRVGQLTEGDLKRLVGHTVDEDGDIIDKYGNIKGHAEPWSEEEEVEEEVDLSALAGCTVNKAGNVVDSSGTILGRVAEGDPATLAGKKVDGKGQIWDNEGNVIGLAELAHGQKSGPEGPFAGFDNATVTKDGTVQTPSGEIIGRVTEGDIKKLEGHKVDEDGDINDKNGNVIGKAERWEPEEKERRVNPMSGMRVNKEGEVRDENGDIIGRLTAGDLGHCAGLEIDDNGYVVDNDGNKVGEVTLLENIQEEEEVPEDETDEERQRREDSELAKKMSAICEDTLQRVQPVMKQITEYIEQADRTPRDELDEEELVNNVKPLIEEGSRILNDCNGSLRGLDPDGRIAAQAKGRQQTGEASPEEYKLADNLKELTTTVVTTIDNAKKKISDMPHAKKKLNPLWALLTEPLFQIIAAVGLLLTGVLNLVGKLLNGLGLGGLVNGLLGGLGINKLLGGLGLGGLTDMLGGKDDKKKKKGGNGPMSMVGGLLGKK